MTLGWDTSWRSKEERLPVEEFFAFHLSSRDCRAFCPSAQFVLARYRLRATIHITFFHPVYQKLGIPRFSFCRTTFYPCFFFFSFTVYARSSNNIQIFTIFVRENGSTTCFLVDFFLSTFGFYTIRIFLKNKFVKIKIFCPILICNEFGGEQSNFERT